jgi:hypothetical protein
MSADAGPEWGIALDLGENWYPLPLDEDPDEFGARVIEILIEDAPAVTGQELSGEVAEAVAAEFTAMTAHAQRTGAFAASLYRPLYDGPTVAVLESHVNAGSPGTPLRAWVESEHPDLGRNHEFTDVRLPIGDAVRLWQVSGRPDDQAEAVMVESVAYFFEAPGDDVIRLGLSWTAPELSGDLQVLADRIARDIAFQ